MILNFARTQAISNLGWVDGGALWLYSLGSNSIRKVTLSDAKYLNISQGQDDFFAVIHHWRGERLEITAHHHSEPEGVVSRVYLKQSFPAPILRRS